MFSFFSIVRFTVSNRQGLARSGTEYGPLTDLPDWSYVGEKQALYLLMLMEHIHT